MGRYVKAALTYRPIGPWLGSVSDRMGDADGPRIASGEWRQLGLLNFAIAGLAGVATRGKPPHIFTTLGRHRGLFRRWLWFAGALMPGGKLPRDRHRAGDPARRPQRRQRVRVGPARADGPAGRAQRRGDRPRSRRPRRAEGWSEREAPCSRATDEMHAEGKIGDELWERLERAARRGAADRALHADRPLRDAGDDPQLAPRRA